MIRGFKMEMTDAARVTDVYSALAASFAVDTQELAEAMSKTASGIASVGVSFESASAMITTITAATRESASVIGSSLKSLSARYGSIKTDPSALVDAEGQEISLNKIDKALKSIGVSIKDANGQLRDMDDVVLELGEKWNTLNRNEQRYDYITKIHENYCEFLTNANCILTHRNAGIFQNGTIRF